LLDGFPSNRMMRLLISLTVAALVLAGCGTRSARPAAPEPESPVTSSPVSPGPVPSPTPRLLEPEPGLVQVRPQPWDSSEVLGPRTVQVAFIGGVEECYGLDRVEVRERPERVEITVFVGWKPEAEVCIDLGEFQAARVTLDEPVGDREIVDGSAVA
jgi:hypothetical protein